MKDFLEQGQPSEPSPSFSRQSSPHSLQQNTAAPDACPLNTYSSHRLEAAKGELSYLRSHGFKTVLSIPFARLEGLFPQLAERAKHPAKQLRAFFVLVPEYSLDNGSAYLCEEEIDESDFYDIESTSPTYIRRLHATESSKAKVGKTFCTYSSMVRLALHSLSLTNTLQ